MGVRRTELPFEGQFTQIPNRWLRDERLSRRARGLLAEIMSHRVGWHVTISGLQKVGREGRDAIATALRELKDFGYVRLAQGRGDGGRWNEVEYELCDPDTGDGFSGSGGFTGTGSAASGSTATGESDTKKNIQKKTISGEDQEGPRSRGSRISESFAVDDVMGQWAKTNAPSVDVVAETETFKEYWGAKAGREAVKLNWRLTWQTWMRRQHGWNVDRGWKPKPVVANASDELIAEQKAAWCAAHGTTPEEWDAHEHDDEWRQEVMNRA
jgi:hypothetical protein